MRPIAINPSYHHQAHFLVPLLALLGFPVGASAYSLLASSQSFAILGSETVTNTGTTTINGDMGVWPGLTMTGLGTVTLTGSVHPGDAPAHIGRADASNAFTTLSAIPFTADLTAQDLGSVGVLSPGIFRFASTAQLTGNLTLDFSGHPDGAFVFQIGSALNTATDSSVTVLHGGPASAIYWVVGSSATLGVGSLFTGNILADQSITFDHQAKLLCGRGIALHAAVTLDTNSISNDCRGGGDLGSGRGDFGSLGFSGGGGVAVPEPATWAMMVFSFGAIGAALRGLRSKLPTVAA